jgi:hypothetical protein
LIEHDTRLRVGRGIAQTETEASRQALAMLKARSHADQPPALASDGWGGVREALVEVYGRVPPKKPGPGRPPTRKRPQAQWQYLQRVKQRQNGRVVGVEAGVIYGDAAQVRARLGEHTAYVERTHLTSRLMNGRLVRKTLGFSKAVEMFSAACIWEDVVYSFARPLKPLRLEVQDGCRHWLPRSPAVAAGITDHVWTIEQLLTHVPCPVNTYKGDYLFLTC